MILTSSNDFWVQTKPVLNRDAMERMDKFNAEIGRGELNLHISFLAPKSFLKAAEIGTTPASASGAD